MKNHTLEKEGFEIHKAVVNSTRLQELRNEANCVAADAGSSCVRHLRSHSEMIQQLAESQMLIDLLPKNMRPVRSILFDKTVKENWPVVWHQDLTIAVKEKHELKDYGPWSFKDGFPHVQPPVSLLENMITIRIHLDDALKTNGALRVLPGSHLYGKMNSNSIAESTKNAVEKEVICECRAGDILLMKPLILHASRRSEIPNRRRVIHFEYARNEDLDGTLKWAEISKNK